MKQVKKFIGCVMLMGIGLTGWAQESAKSDYVSDQIARQKVVENGGSGRYRSVVVTEKTLENYTVYRPRSVKAAARHEGPLPVLIWCNGACSDNSKGYENMLNEIASHGYLVVAIGKMKVQDSDREDGGSNEKQVVEAMNWVIKMAAKKTSDYYKAVDVNNMAVAGHSCGGAQAIANCANARVKTLLIMNAGMGGMSMGGASPQTLKQLHCPLIYMSGGPDDVAYGNAKTDFGSITKVPVVWADLPTAGHGGTYWYSKGGDFGKVALKWMDWQLKGYSENARAFLKPDLSVFPNWKIQNKNFGEVDYDAPFQTQLTVGDSVFDRRGAEETFAFGADVSSLTQLTQKGTTFYNRVGVKKNVLPILKEEGMNSVRLSVLVNPSDGVCNMAYARALAMKAKEQGMSVMLCLHYTDNRTDMGSQLKPAAWKGHDVETLEKDIRTHTNMVVKAIKGTGADLKWVQVGYQLDDGMLWPEGRLSNGEEGVKNFARFFNTAYDAVKAIDPEVEVVLHVADLQSNTLFNSYFDDLVEAGVKWDAIGLSAYPQVSDLQPSVLIAKTVEAVKHLQERYEKPVMVVETGHYNDQPLESNHFLCNFLQKLIEAGAQGCFYWEPEVTDDYRLGAWNPKTRRVSIALEAFNGLKHTEVPYIMDIAWDTNMDAIFNSRETILLPTKARHIRDRIEKVELKEGRVTQATSTESPFTIAWEEAEPGIHNLSALATARDGETASTDTVEVVVGPAAVLTQNTTETDAEGTATRSWEMDFKQGGAYLLVFRYRSDETQYVKLYLDDTAETSFIFKPTEGEGKASRTRKCSIDEAGKKVVKLVATSGYTLPDIESLIVIPLEGQPLTDEEVLGMDTVSAPNDVRLKVGRSKLTVEANKPLRRIRVYSINGMMLSEKRVNGGLQASLSVDTKQKGMLLLVQVETEDGVKTMRIRE